MWNLLIHRVLWYQTSSFQAVYGQVNGQRQLRNPKYIHSNIRIRCPSGWTSMTATDITNITQRAILCVGSMTRAQVLSCMARPKVTFSLSKLLRLKPAVSSVIIIIPLTSEMDSISTHCIRKDILRIGIGLDRKKVPLLEYRPWLNRPRRWWRPEEDLQAQQPPAPSHRWWKTWPRTARRWVHTPWPREPPESRRYRSGNEWWGWGRWEPTSKDLRQRQRFIEGDRDTKRETGRCCQHIFISAIQPRCFTMPRPTHLQHILYVTHAAVVSHILSLENVSAFQRPLLFHWCVFTCRGN